MTVSALHPFDRDAALVDAGENRWRGNVSEDWWVVAGPFGGYLSSFLVRALMQMAPDRAPRSLTVHFLSAAAAGPVEVTGEILRVGGAMTSVQLRMEQEGRPVAVALAAAATWKDGEAEWVDLRAPAVPGPDECPPVPAAESAPRFFERFEFRFADGGSPARAAERAYNAAWVSFAPERTLDHLAVTALADGWLPAAFSRLGRFAVVPTLDLTIHFRAPLPASGTWALVTNSSRLASGGVWEEDTDVWSANGTLLAQARQLALIRG